MSGDYTICTNQATCPDSCAECSDTITCTECENGQYLGSGDQCFGCMENCNLCSSDSACTQCSNTYKLETDGSCAKCQYSREYFAECIKCENAGSSLDTCTVCVNSVAHTFTKEIYSTTTYGLIDEENDYVDCLTRCPTGAYPEFTFSSNLSIESSKCIADSVTFSTSNCYEFSFADASSGDYLCRSCMKGFYLRLSDKTCQPKDSSSTPSFELHMSPDDQNDASQDGSEASPFEWFFNVLAKAIELAAPFEEATVTINLHVGDHFILAKDYSLYVPAYTDQNS